MWGGSGSGFGTYQKRRRKDDDDDDRRDREERTPWDDRVVDPPTPYTGPAVYGGGMPSVRNFQPFLPGQQFKLAQQLSQGYSQPPEGGAATWNDWLGKLYQPMTTLQMPHPFSVYEKHGEGLKNFATGNSFLDSILRRAGGSGSDNDDDEDHRDD
jgi:hypothetical protein